MNKFVINLFYVLLLLVQAACTDDMEWGTAGQYSEASGQLTLSFEELTGRDIHISRTVLNGNEENFLHSLRIYVFSESGRLTGYTCLTGDGVHPIPTPRGKVTVSARGGKSYIYAIANLKTAQYYVSPEDFALLDVDPARVTASELTRERFLSVSFQRQPNSLLPLDNHFLMSGYANYGHPVTIVPAGAGRLTLSEPTAADDRVIKLYRVVSKNKISVKSAPGSHFTLTRYELHNVALSGTLLPSPPRQLAPTQGSFEQMDPIQVTTENTVEFYLPENIQKNTQGIIKSWEDREKNVYDSLKVTKTFTHAPENASYIVLNGKFSNEADKIAAEVTYTIHFGDIGARLDRLDNFEVERNCTYTYNITINGVNDIIVEARKEGDHPYAEGNVIHIHNGTIYELDAHYESRILKFVKGGISNGMEMIYDKQEYHGYIAYISTPFGKSRSVCVEKSQKNGKIYLYDVFEQGSTKTPLCEIRENGLYDHNGRPITDEQTLTDIFGMSDYKWARFRKNTPHNLVGDKTDLSRYVCKYPGDQFFMKPSDLMNIHLTGDKEPLIDIYTLLYNLAKHDTDTENTYWNAVDSKGKSCVYYTCFVDENYYEHKSWDLYVNQPDRIMHVASEIDISDDEHSTYMSVLYTLSQKSIKTFYNPSYASEVKAYGIESVTDEQHPVSGSSRDIVSFRNTDYDFSDAHKEKWNGHTSAVKRMDRNSWNQPHTRYLVNQQPLHTTVSTSMLSRNRDLNGNGVIDADEIRWYVGAVGQYVGIWLCEEILPAESRLFDITLMHDFVLGSFPHEWHYFTASSPEIFWAEEGSSTSGLYAGDWSQARQVRCFRTLESSGKGLSDPDTYFQSRRLLSRDGEIEVSLDRVDSRALRPHVNTMLGVHYERDEQNLLPSHFKIAKSFAHNLNTSQRSEFFTWQEVKNPSNMSGIDTGSEEPGWRVPNQRELCVMVFADDNRCRGIWCRTKYNGSRYGAFHQGYKNNISGYARLDNGNMTVQVNKNRMKVICVKDIQ